MSVEQKINSIKASVYGCYESIDAMGGTLPDKTNLDNLDGAIQTLGHIPSKGFILENHNANGYPTTLRFVGDWTEIPTRMFSGMFSSGALNPNLLGYITSIDIPNGVTSIGENAFYSSNGLTSITFPNTLTSIGSDVFYQFGGTSLVIPNSVTSIGSSAFEYCIKLTSITLSQSITSIPVSMLNNCSKLTSVTIPNRVTSIGTDAFRSCTGLTSMTIPNSVTIIDQRAFWSCSNVTSFILNCDISNISNNTFNGCTKCALYDFSHCTSVPTLYSTGSLGHKANCVIKVPQALLTDWRNATNWSALTNVTWEGV